jgi:ABC-type multidrug transport system fused ATPase/permease subunit
MARECTDRIPQSEIYQLENVDLKLIFNLFKNLYLLFEAPITVIGALFLLFLESPSYGMIAIYWFIIAFFLQRELDGRMSHCNQTKLKLIDKRSQINYEILRKIKSAKLAGCESLLIEKNNDLFME